MPTNGLTSVEHQRLSHPAWRRWGPYLSERQWGTVREDYSENGTAWDYFTHDGLFIVTEKFLALSHNRLIQ
jgi:hypothetical protein